MTPAPPRPPLASGSLVSHTEETRLGAAPDRLWPWFVATPLEAMLPGGGGLPKVTRTEPLDGPPWGEVGAGRRVFLEDGTSVAEAITEAAPPRLFRYQVWGFEGLPARLLSHAQGEFVFDAADGGTALRWTYAFKPRSGLLRPLVGLFVRRQFAPFMRAGLGVMAARAASDLGDA